MAFKVRSVRYNFLMNLLLTGSSILFPLITFPIVSRALLADAYGLVGFAVSVASWASIIAMLGVNRYGVREVARVRDDARALARTTAEIFAVTAASTLVVWVCLIASLFLVERFGADRLLFFVNGFTVLCNTLGAAWFFQGIEQYRYISVRGVVVRAVCFIGVLLLVHEPGDYLVYAVLLVASAAVANIVNFVYMLRILRQGLREQEGSEPSGGRGTAFPDGAFRPLRHLRPLLVFSVIVAAISIYTMLDTVMLGFMSSNAQVGFYTAAIAVKNALVALVSALSNVLLPRAAYLLGQGDQAGFKQLVRKAVRTVLLISVPLAVIVCIVAKPLMTWYAGADFAQAGPVLSVVAVAVVPIGLSVIFCDEVMIQIGMEKRCTWIYLGAAAVDFVCNLALIPVFGALGAAIATTFVECGITVVEFLIVRRFFWGGPSGGGMEIPLSCEGGR